MVNVRDKEIRFRFFRPGAAAVRLVYAPSGVNGIRRVAQETQGLLSRSRSNPPGPNRRGGRFAAAGNYERCSA